MAPDLVISSLSTISERSVVLDPMCGSGTVPRVAAEAGFRCVGGDLDPLAVLMARVWTEPQEVQRMSACAEKLVDTAKSLKECEPEGFGDPETKRFVSYWFAPPQRERLARLAKALRNLAEPMRGAMAIAMSRIIVSKEMMASLARDTSHSRPHRVALSNDFDVYGGFLKAVRVVATRLAPDRIKVRSDIWRMDARKLEDLEDGSFDLVITSPPYLNAIDYLRGHRLALVWLGYKMGELRRIRASGVGVERAIGEDVVSEGVSRFVEEGRESRLAPRHWGWIRRYCVDMDAVLRQLGRVVKPRGKVVMVVGNSFLRGAKIQNDKLITWLAERTGMRTGKSQIRRIPARRRYLPPPGDGQGALDTRMRLETVLTFEV